MITVRTLYLVTAYLSMVFISPFWYQRTAPLNFPRLLIAYNLICCLLSAVSATGFTYSLLFDCSSVFSLEPCSSQAIGASFQVYYYTKVIELLDTVWMVLRHRKRQISFLHVFHHSTMLLLSDYAYRTQWPAMSVSLCMNSYIHVLLYFYYMRTVGATTAPVWKRRLTELQILQFAIGIVHAGVGYIWHGFCLYSAIYGIALLLLFSQFYYYSYLKPRMPANSKTQPKQS